MADPETELQRRKKALRERLRSLSPTEKIRELEALQERYYELQMIREQNGGPPIPIEWQQWQTAQSLINKTK